jgi:tricorn protease
MRAAENGQMLADGRFIIEGRGVSPDIAVDNPPRASAEGRDDQLDAALAYLQKAMADHPMAQPRPGPYPRPVQP